MKKTRLVLKPQIKTALLGIALGSILLLAMRLAVSIN